MSKKYPILLVVLLAVTACATVTKVPVAWKDSGYEGGTFERVLIIGVSKDPAVRRTFEDEFATAITMQGTLATPSYNVLPDTGYASKEAIDQVLQQYQFDGLIVSRLLTVDQDTTYVPPRPYVVPRAYYDYYGFYNAAWGVTYEPGYTVRHTTVKLETNLYDANPKHLVWSGQSNTFDPASERDVINSATRAIVERLAAEELIGRPAFGRP